ncbi:MAG: CDP-glycerol glycerophosphotransferase family protein [Candidatus Omnitrophica bacterium]|nr:CDP-glycerol glycerophosphotransferase family protein [Candidatus Omnitrophota bacterium]
MPKGLKVLKKAGIWISALVLNLFLSVFRLFLSILKPIKPRVYFCYNQSIHQIYHSLFVAIELSNCAKEFDVVILSTSAQASDIIEDELASIPNRVIFKKIRHPGYGRVDYSVNWFVLHCYFRMRDPLAVVVPDYYDNVFRSLWLKTFWVYVSHGVANRFFSFDKHVRDYDLAILPGERDAKAFQEHLGPMKNAETLGYSKLDYFHYHRVKPRILFKDNKPVILYNPHFERSLSSFFDQGAMLIKAIYDTGRYNVIFMPHPDLARKYPRLVEEVRSFPGVALINRPKVNLEYMATSDLYITDISSSVYEWFYFNRPVLFFNTKKVAWKTNPYYASWASGDVAEDVPGALKAIEHALANPEEHGAIRRQLFAQTFFHPERIVSRDIACAITKRLHG